MELLQKEQVDVALSNTLDELQFLHGEASVAGLLLSTPPEDHETAKM